MMQKIIFIVTGLGLVGVIGYGAYVASQHPIHDITTDFADPPQIVAGAADDINRKNPAAYTGADKIGDKTIADTQRDLYPDIGPLLVGADQQKVFSAALALVEQQEGFSLLASDVSTGTIEAIFTSSVFKFVDDFIIRVRDEEGKTRIDFRSKSRVGRSDLGANARRITEFKKQLAEAL